MANDRLVLEITTPNGRKIPIDVATTRWDYAADLARFQEIWGEQNVKEVK